MAFVTLSNSVFVPCLHYCNYVDKTELMCISQQQREQNVELRYVLW